MFTGIVEELGIVKSFSRMSPFSLLEVNCQKTLEDTKIGDSIWVNGVWLCVINKKCPLLSFEVMPQTLKKTNLGQLGPNSVVNLERALKLGDRICGHFLSGHIDCVGLIKDRKNTQEGTIFEIKVPQEF
ncbi:MAG: riboflavin synthase, partial [Candidatus Omnitrophica bacterium]|nr:riboflavin synthase [Candidatus Omnitrophota bacterium]